MTYSPELHLWAPYPQPSSYQTHSQKLHSVEDAVYPPPKLLRPTVTRRSYGSTSYTLTDMPKLPLVVAKRSTPCELDPIVTNRGDPPDSGRYQHIQRDVDMPGTNLRPPLGVKNHTNADATSEPLTQLRRGCHRFPSASEIPSRWARGCQHCGSHLDIQRHYLQWAQCRVRRSGHRLCRPADDSVVQRAHRSS